MKFIKIISSMFVMILLLSNLTASASSIKLDFSKERSLPMEEIDLPEISEENLDYALEIANSDLEEKAIFENGEFKNYYQSNEDAKVSVVAFNKFNEILKVLNEEINKGNIITDGSLLDIQLTEDNSIKVNWSVSNKWYGTVLSITGTEANKIQKVLAAGGGVAGLATALGGISGIWAGVIFALYGLGELCNWNNKGYNVHRSWTGQFWCTPK